MRDRHDGYHPAAAFAVGRGLCYHAPAWLACTGRGALLPIICCSRRRFRPRPLVHEGVGGAMSLPPLSAKSMIWIVRTGMMNTTTTAALSTILEDEDDNTDHQEAQDAAAIASNKRKNGCIVVESRVMYAAPLK